MSNTYFRFPGVAYEALTNGDLSALQFVILVLLYRRANWKTGVVRSISAEQVIRDLGDTGLIPAAPTPNARKQIVQRAMKAMRLAGWFTSDYKTGSKRPYDITLTSYLSLCTAERADAENSTEMDADGDADGIILNHGEITSSAKRNMELDADGDADERGNFDADVTLTRFGRDAEVIASNQANTERESPLPPEGVPPLPSPTGMRSDAAGLKNQNRTANPADKEKLLRDVAVLFADFVLWLSLNNFSPDVVHIEDLLRDFHPVEILFAYVRRFEPWDNKRYKTGDVAQFFRRAARSSIEAARLQEPATPAWFRSAHFIDPQRPLSSCEVHYATKKNLADLRKHWSLVIAAWNKFNGVKS
jgi:hypothetical protein